MRWMMICLILLLLVPLAQAKEVRVTISNFNFAPERIDVETGDTIIFENKDPFPHTATALDGSFNSDIIFPDQTASVTFNEPGTFDFQCTFHPSMKGAVIVTGDATAPAQTGGQDDVVTVGTESQAPPAQTSAPIKDLSFDELLALVDRFTNSPLINVSPICDVLEDARGQVDFACWTDGKWRKVDDERPRFLIDNPEDPLGPKGCCPINSCWTGEECIDDQTDDPSFTLHEGKRCIAGFLSVAEPKFRFDRTQKGFCPQETQCLLNVDGTPENNDKPETFFFGTPKDSPVCIGDGQSVLEFYCKGGEWTSRTKYLAVQLAELAESAGGGYTIFCDEYEEVLNFFSYAPEEAQGKVARTFLEDETCKRGKCVNQFCGMAYKDGLAFGTSLNEDLDSPVHSYLMALDLPPDSCNGIPEDQDGFVECQAGTDVYYNPRLHAVITIPEGTLPSVPVSELEQRSGIIYEPFDRITEIAQQNLDQAGFVGRSDLFSRLYIDKRGDKEYFSFVAEDIADQDRSNLPNTYVVGLYNRIDISDPSGRNPCTLISTVDPGILAGSGFCNFDPASKQMDFVRYSLGDAPNVLEQNWRDVTAKFRVG